MKYDRPVWQIFGECADALPTRFRYDDVKAWFDEHYPEVGEATIRAHLVGLSEGPHARAAQFANKESLFRRITHGEYEVIGRPDATGRKRPVASRKMAAQKTAARRSARRTSDVEPEEADAIPGAPDVPVAEVTVEPEAPAPEDSAPSVPGLAPPPTDDVVVLQEVDEVSAGGADAVLVSSAEASFYRDYVKQAREEGARVFVLSAEYGIVDPYEWSSGYERFLPDLDGEYQQAWIEWVVSKLASFLVPLRGARIEIFAADDVAEPLRTRLADVGAIAHTPSRGLVLPPVAPAEPEPVVEAMPVQELEPEPEREPVVPVPLVEPTPMSLEVAAEAAVSLLGNPFYVHALPEIRDIPDRPGLYSWWVDVQGARDLSVGLQQPVRAGLLYVGAAAPSVHHIGLAAGSTLRSVIVGDQLDGSSSHSSAFRLSIASVLRERFGLRTLSDPRIRAWMWEHLSLAVWLAPHTESLRDVEETVVAKLNPPLNLAHVGSSDLRTHLTALRRA